MIDYKKLQVNKLYESLSILLIKIVRYNYISSNLNFFIKKMGWNISKNLDSFLMRYLTRYLANYHTLHHLKSNRYVSHIYFRENKINVVATWLDVVKLLTIYFGHSFIMMNHDMTQRENPHYTRVSLGICLVRNYIERKIYCVLFF